MVILSEFGLYLCFALWAGSLLVQVIPKKNLPEIHVPKAVMLLSIVGIVLFSFVSLLRVILYFADDPDLSFGQVFLSVLLTFEIGKAWLGTLALSFVLFILVWLDVYHKPGYVIISFIVTLGLTVAFGLASHAATVHGWGGFFAHSAHFAAMIVWVGLMLVVGWFSKDEANWEAFLRWFTPLAATCVVVTIVAGLVLMLYITPEYVNSWVFPYGQALLVKHLLIVPLLVVVFVNGFLMKRFLKRVVRIRPTKWLRAEGIIVLIIFAVTAYMGQQEPPHDVSSTSQTAELSTLFLWFHGGALPPEPTLGVSMSASSMVLALAACLFLSAIVLSFVRRAPAFLVIPFSVVSVIAGYMSLMLSLR